MTDEPPRFCSPNSKCLARTELHTVENKPYQEVGSGRTKRRDRYHAGFEAYSRSLTEDY